MESNTERTWRAYAAFTASDVQVLTELIAPDVRWVVGGAHSLSGSYVGRGATFAYFSRLMLVTEGTFRIAPESVTEIDASTVLVVARVSARARGQRLDELMVQLLEIRDGQATHARSFLENGHRWDELFGRTPSLLAHAQGLRA